MISSGNRLYIPGAKHSQKGEEEEISISRSKCKRTTCDGEGPGALCFVTSHILHLGGRMATLPKYRVE